LNARSVDDEQMVNAILQSNPNAKQLYIVDTRPKVQYELHQYGVIFERKNLQYLYTNPDDTTRKKSSISVKMLLAMRFYSLTMLRFYSLTMFSRGPASAIFGTSFLCVKTEVQMITYRRNFLFHCRSTPWRTEPLVKATKIQNFTRMWNFSFWE
jgi:hypothetical protein